MSGKRSSPPPSLSAPDNARHTPSPDPMDANCGCDRIDEHPDYWPDPANGTREDQVDVHGRLCKLPEPYPPDDCEQLDIESEAVN